MNPTIVIVMLSAMLVLALHFDRRRRERDSRAEDSSVAAGFKRWLLGSNDAHMMAPQAMEEVSTTRLRVRGSLPPESWSMLATALLANVPSDAPVTAAVDVSFAIETNHARAVAANLNALISELALSGLSVEPVDPPRKFASRRVVIRLRNLSPRLQVLLGVSH
jgi:hypothetical protein